MNPHSKNLDIVYVQITIGRGKGHCPIWGSSSGPQHGRGLGVLGKPSTAAMRFGRKSLKKWLDANVSRCKTDLPLFNRAFLSGAG